MGSTNDQTLYLTHVLYPQNKTKQTVKTITNKNDVF